MHSHRLSALYHELSRVLSLSVCGSRPVWGAGHGTSGRHFDRACSSRRRSTGSPTRLVVCQPTAAHSPESTSFPFYCHRTTIRSTTPFSLVLPVSFLHPARAMTQRRKKGSLPPQMDPKWCFLCAYVACVADRRANAASRMFSGHYSNPSRPTMHVSTSTRCTRQKLPNVALRQKV